MWHLRSLHTFHLCRRRALRQRTLQVRESRLRAFRDHLHRPVAQVAGESPEPQTRRLAPHPPAEPHALDVAVHEEARSEEHTSELQSLTNLVCRLLLEKNNPPASTEAALA